MLDGVPIKYRMYGKEKTVISKHIKLERDTAENVNKVIAIFNASQKAIKLNNDLLINIAIDGFLNSFDTQDELLKELKNKALEL